MSAAEYLGTFPNGSEQWHAARRTGIGSSEIAAVLGLSPYESKFSLWHRKQQYAEPTPENDEMRWGTLLEDVIARRFAYEHPELRVRRTGTWRNKARPYQLANPDRLVRGSLVEIKNMPYSDGWGPSGSDEIPVYYRAQVLWQLDTLGLDEAWLAVLIRGGDYREYRIPFDLHDAMVMRDAAEQFWISIRDGVRPDIDAHSETYRLVREAHPGIDDRDVEIGSELARNYQHAIELADAAATEKSYWTAVLLDELGDARNAVCDGQRIAYRKPGPRGSIALCPVRTATTQTIQGAAA